MRTRVLVIDDDPFVRDLIGEMLAPRAFEVRTASDGAGGLELAAAARPHVVLLDVDLGEGADGFSVCEQLMALVPPPPVVFLTSHDEPASVERGLAAGALAYLCKPFSALELLDQVERCRSRSEP